MGFFSRRTTPCQVTHHGTQETGTHDLGLMINHTASGSLALVVRLPNSAPRSPLDRDHLLSRPCARRSSLGSSSSRTVACRWTPPCVGPFLDPYATAARTHSPLGLRLTHCGATLDLKKQLADSSHIPEMKHVIELAPGGASAPQEDALAIEEWAGDVRSHTPHARALAPADKLGAVQRSPWGNGHAPPLKQISIQIKNIEDYHRDPQDGPPSGSRAWRSSAVHAECFRTVRSQRGSI